MNTLQPKIILLLASFSLLSAQAQDRPDKVTEVWEPVPEEVSPGTNGSAPSDAIILFDGSNLSAWENTDGQPPEWSVADGAMSVVPGTGDIRTKEGFGDMQLHIEWKSPTEIKGEGQGRGNSGVFLMDRYEVQVLDCYQNETYPNGQAASVYKQHIPLVNACRKPGEWQTYDIIFTAPRFSKDGVVTHPARVTVIHNGVLVQNNVVIWGPTKFIGLPTYSMHGMEEPLRLQDHGDLVSFRNIWVRKL